MMKTALFSGRDVVKYFGKLNKEDESNMSIESRLAAKKRSEQARKKEKIGKVMKVVAVIVVICIIAGAVFGVYWNIQSKKIEYSKYVTDDGNIVDVDPKDYITLVDYKAMDITLKDYEPTDKELTEYIEKLMDEAEKKAKEDEKAETKSSSEAEDADTSDDAAKDDAADKDEFKPLVKELTDDWVKKYAKDTLEKAKYEVTAKGYQEYAFNKLYKSNIDSNLVGDITTYLNDKSTIGKYPEDYTKNLIQICKNVEKQNFEAYASFYAMYGYTSVYQAYGSKAAFNEAMDKQARAYVKDTLVCLAIYEELGLSYTVDDAKKYFEEELEQDFDEQAEICGEGYLIMNYKCEQVVSYFEDLIKEAGKYDEIKVEEAETK